MVTMDERLRRRLAIKVAIHCISALMILTAALVMGAHGRLAPAIVVAFLAVLPIGLAALYVRALRRGSFAAAVDQPQ